MHKFTIFTVVFALLMLSAVTELALTKANNQNPGNPSSNLGQTQLPNSAQAASLETTDTQAPLLNASLLDSAQAATQSTQATQNTQSPTEATEKKKNTKVKALVDIFKAKSRFIMLMPSLYIENKNYFELEFEGKLFDTIDTSNFDVQAVYQVQIESNSKEVATVYEMAFKDIPKAELAYNITQATANSFKQIQTNPTNEFADESFYINNPSKVDRAFVVIRHSTILYAINYQKDLHASFKDFYPVLFK
jgi:hypothetical protein